MSGPDEARLWRRLVGWLRGVLRQGFVPFHTARRLTGAQRRVVAAVWGATGASFSILWTAAVALLLRGNAGGSLGLVAVALVLGAGLFFAAAGYLMATVGSALIARQPGHAGQSEPGERDTNS